MSQNELKEGDVLIQSVDLIKFIARQKNIHLPFKHILQICGLIIVLFLGYSLYNYWKISIINKHIAQLNLQYTDLVKNVHPDRIKKVSSNSSTFQAKLLQDSSGFTNYLETLAASCPNGLWLTSIDIKKRTNTTILLGKAYRPNNIVQFVQNLNRTQLFKTKPLFLARIEKVGELYNFILQTRVNAEVKI